LVASGIPGVRFDGEFLLELNTFSVTKQVETFLIDSGTGRFVRDANDKLVVGDVNVDSGFRLKMRGSLNIADTITLNGEFSFSFNGNELEVLANARAT